MKQRRFFLYLLLGGILILAALSVYFYQEYLGEDATSTLDGQNPIIAQPVNGIVTRTAVNMIDHQQKLDVTYTAIDSKEATHFTLNTEYGPRIHIGDTITKDRGEKMLLVNRKDGQTEMVPID